MKKTITKLVTFMLMGITLFAQASDKQLDAKLAMFADYLGTWQSNFTVAPGKPSVTDVSMWERALNGKAVRTLHSINNGEYGGESLIFFDKEKDSLVFYYFTTAGFYTSGTIEVINETQFVAYEDVSGNDSGITKVKSTSDLQKDRLLVSTSYLKNGKWTEPEQRVYTKSDRKVIFK